MGEQSTFSIITHWFQFIDLTMFSFVSILSSTLHCECPPGFEGMHCEFLTAESDDAGTTPSKIDGSDVKMSTLSIVFIAVGAVGLVAWALVAYSYPKAEPAEKRTKESSNDKKKSREEGNGDGGFSSVDIL